MNLSQPIRIMIVDDHAMVRAGLITFLEVSDSFVLVAEATSGREAIELCDKFSPDVVLMDLVMPEMSGVEATREIRKSNPDIQVIALTSFQEGKMVQDALKADAGPLPNAEASPQLPAAAGKPGQDKWTPAGHPRFRGHNWQSAGPVHIF